MEPDLTRQSASTSTVMAEVRDFLSSVSGRIPGDTEDFFQLGYLNSLRALELVTFIERRFDLAVEVDDLHLDNFRTISRIAEFVRRKRSAQPTTAGRPAPAN